MTTYDDRLAGYIREYFARPDGALLQVERNIPERGLPAINVQPEEGRFLQFLARVVGARRAVEIGTLGGYSGIWIARGMLPGGKLFTLEKEAERAELAREHFTLAGVADRVEVWVGEASETLKDLRSEGPFDFCFIDADKLGYDRYLDWALDNVRVGGVVAAHNAFRHGAVADPEATQAEDRFMREFNARFAGEPRLLSTIYPAGDGTLIGVRVA